MQCLYVDNFVGHLTFIVHHTNKDTLIITVWRWFYVSIASLIVSEITAPYLCLSPGKFTLRFSLRSPLRGTHLGEPWGIAVSFDGKVLVSDWEKSCIHIFDESGKYVGNFGSANVTTALKYPAGIAIDKRGQVVVADRGNHCIWRFTPDGQPLSRFGKQGHAPGELFFPFGVAIDKEGNIIVSESGNHRISFFTANGKFLRCFGKKGTQPGMFQYPRHLCIDQQGRLVVADELNQRLQIFSV